MELISERSEKEIAADRALSQADEALRRLAANIMRITAGAGKSYDLLREASAFITACVAYGDAVGDLPSDCHLDEVLRPPRYPEYWDRLDDENKREVRAVETITSGVLRAVAARLVGPPVQGTRANHLIYEGVNAIIDLRRERDARWASERRSAVAVRRKPREALKKKPAATPRTGGKPKEPT